MIKKAFITGPTGAIGIALINILIKNRFKVIAICRKNSSRIKFIPKDDNVKVVMCDLEELNNISYSELGQGEYFFHLAWAGTSGDDRNNLDLQLRNVQYTLDCVRLAKRLGCKKFIGVGSQAEYGLKKVKLSTNISMNPITGYGAGKLCASHMSGIEAQKLGIDFNWVRVLSVYGPYDGAHTLIMSVIKKLVNNEAIALTEGIQVWDYLYSGDAANALCLIAEKGINGKAYVLGSGESLMLKQYIEVIYKIIPNHSELLWGKIPYNPQSVMYLCASLEELKKDTGFVPETSFEVGITNTYHWFKEACNYEKN